jgi:hypothetical protein
VFWFQRLAAPNPIDFHLVFPADMVVMVAMLVSRLFAKWPQCFLMILGSHLLRWTTHDAFQNLLLRIRIFIVDRIVK